MVDVMLNSIAIEPNRWGNGQIPHKDITELLPIIAGGGFTSVEMWQYHISRKSIDEVREVRKVADNAGLSIPVIGAYPLFHLEGEEAEAERETQMGLLDRAEILGTPVIKMFLGRVKGNEITPEQLAMTGERVIAWAEAARARGIRFCAELHGNTLFDPEESGEAFLASHPDLDMAICYQPYNFQSTEASLALADRFAGRIIHVHLQGHGPEMEYVPLTEGVLDYSQILPKIASQNPGVTYGIEFVRGGMAPAESLDYSLALADARLDKEFVEGLLS